MGVGRVSVLFVQNINFYSQLLQEINLLCLNDQRYIFSTARCYVFRLFFSFPLFNPTQFPDECK